MDEVELRRRVARWGGPTGWWHKRNEDTYVALALRLIEQGVTPDEALDVLGLAHMATCDEFGAS